MANTVLISQACLQVTDFKQRDGSDECGLITEITDKVQESAKAITGTNLRSLHAIRLPHAGNRLPKVDLSPRAECSHVPGSVSAFPHHRHLAQVLVCEGEVCPCILTEEAKQVQGPSLA